MDRLFALVGACLGFLAVALGAFGSHALRGRLDVAMLEVYRTAVTYHFVHTLALLAVAWWCSRFPSVAAVAAGWLFVVGSVLFCGSLYALAITGVRVLGVVTPFGGVAYLAGWAALGWAAFRALP